VNLGWARRFNSMIRRSFLRDFGLARSDPMRSFGPVRPQPAVTVQRWSGCSQCRVSTTAGSMAFSCRIAPNWSPIPEPKPDPTGVDGRGLQQLWSWLFPADPHRQPLSPCWQTGRWAMWPTRFRIVIRSTMRSPHLTAAVVILIQGFLAWPAIFGTLGFLRRTHLTRRARPETVARRPAG